MCTAKLSVIVPAYNVATTLRGCVESIVAQGEGIEIIIVNDGSTDNTPAVAEELKAAHDNIKVISRLNGGLSAARNSGIEAASGDLITFVDSDDSLKANIYPAMMKRMEECGECDFIEFSLVRRVGGKETSPVVLANATYRDSRDYWLSGKAYEHAYAWNKIFRRRVFFGSDGANIRFEEGRTFEDIEFLAALLLREPVIITTDTIGYIYSYNPAGITANAKLTEQTQFLDTHLTMIKRLNIGVGRLSAEETDYYMAVVNIQITQCRMSGEAPRLPSFRVGICRRDCRRLRLLTKKILLNALGITALCRIFRLIYN